MFLFCYAGEGAVASQVTSVRWFCLPRLLFSLHKIISRVRPTKGPPGTPLLRCPRQLARGVEILGPRRWRGATRGFTLVELMVVVLIISVLATISVPALQRMQRKTKTATIVNDFRVFGAAFDT